MIPRRIVTAISADGKAVVQSDGHPPWAKEMVHTPGFASSVIWATAPVPSIPAAKGDPTDAVTTVVPPAGETRFLVVTFPPDAVIRPAGLRFRRRGAGASGRVTWPRRAIRTGQSRDAYDANRRLWRRARR